MPSQEAPSTFVSFPEKEEVLEKLRAMDGYKPELEPLFRLAAERLALKAYDRSAFVFILIELIYEFKGIYGGPMTDLLARSVLALTRDSELAQSALEAYDEINATLEPEGPEEPAPETAEATSKAKGSPVEDGLDDAFLEEAFPVSEDETIGPYLPRVRSQEQERLMRDLQEAQKELADLGLATRMAIDMTLSRPSRDEVSHTLREIESLRSVLRRFDALLAESEIEILQEIGVLKRD